MIETTPTMAYKSCPRCRGDMLLKGVQEPFCIQCGYRPIWNGTSKSFITTQLEQVMAFGVRRPDVVNHRRKRIIRRATF